MSYRDLRNFTEMMRAVGYRRVISLENFKSPNFPLLCEILKWLLAYFDPDIFFPVDNPQMCSERVKFINFAAEFMLTKANIKVNPKKLYEANGYAVKELLKIVSILYDEIKEDNLLRCTNIEDNIAIYIDDKLIEKSVDYANIDCNGSDDETYALLTNLASRTDELREARSLVKDLTEKAAVLYFTIDQEVDLYNNRMLSLNKHFVIEDVERLIEERIKMTSKEITESLNLLEQLVSDKIRLEEKYDKKVLEMERCLRRYGTLMNIKPIYLKDFEIAEVEFGELYEEYLEKHKNVAFLESILSKYDAIEKQCREAAANKVKVKMMRSNATAPTTTSTTFDLNSSFQICKERKTLSNNTPTTTTITSNNNRIKDSDNKTSTPDRQHRLTDLFLIKGTDKVPLPTNSDFFTDKNEDDDDDDNDDEEDDDDDDEEDPFYDLSANNTNNNQLINDIMTNTYDDDDEDDDDYDFSKAAALMMVMDRYGNARPIDNLPGVHNRFGWKNPPVRDFGFPGGVLGGIPPHPYFKNNKRIGGLNRTMMPEDDDDDDNF